jgi:hypothetical protein
MCDFAWSQLPRHAHSSYRIQKVRDGHAGAKVVLASFRVLFLEAGSRRYVLDSKGHNGGGILNAIQHVGLRSRVANLVRK